MPGIRQQRRDLGAAIQKGRGQQIGDDIDASDAITFTGSTDAITLLGMTNTFLVNSSGVNAMTLPTPVAGAVSAGGDDGKIVYILDVGGHAHTATSAANKINGNKHIGTFGGTAYSFMKLMCAGGVYVEISQSGITYS
jgi:hypothetical protein